MDLRGIVAVLLLSSLTVQALAPPPQQPLTDIDGAILKFDDIRLHDPISNISTYEGFHFEGFKVANFSHAYQDGLVEAEDIDCAASAPNAILGSWLPGQPMPRIMLGSVETPKFFKLKTFSLKPLGDAPTGLTIYVYGWNITDGEAVQAYKLFFPTFDSGYQTAQLVNLTVLGWWPDGVNAVEAYATAGLDDTWRFCLDNIEIEYV